MVPAQETDKKFQETNKKMDRLDEQIEETNRIIGRLGNKLGEFVEGLVRPGLCVASCSRCLLLWSVSAFFVEGNVKGLRGAAQFLGRGNDPY